MPNHADKLPVAIVGGGPVGMSLALALHRYGIRCEILDARSRAEHRLDKRVLALSHGSRQTLEWLGAWQNIAATPIMSIHVSQRNGFGRTLITAADEAVDALGYVASAADLSAALDTAVQEAGLIRHERTRVERVDVQGEAAHLIGAGEIRAAALVAYAEGSVGTDMDVRTRDYGQHAVTCMVSVHEPHRERAWERFTPHGPLALLPCGDQFAVVFTCPSQAADEIAAQGDAAFIDRLQREFGRRVRFVSAGPRSVFPLALRYRRDIVGPRQAWLGNAAQTLHPVAGQGFNLALRDIRQLARALNGASDPGEPGVLACYAKSRRLDRAATLAVTDALVRLFSNGNPFLRLLRGTGLLALDMTPPVRSFLARRMMYGARAFP